MRERQIGRLPQTIYINFQQYRFRNDTLFYLEPVQCYAIHGSTPLTMTFCLLILLEATLLFPVKGSP